MSFIQIKEVSKYFGTKQNPIKAVGPVSLEIPKESFTVILGRSGSGKSTLLNLMAGLDQVSDGTLIVGKDDLSKAKNKQLAKYRSKIGIIFQSYNLLPNLSTVENVMMGAWAGGKNLDKQKAVDLLKEIGLGHRIEANVKTLSGGERQRVAICRSLIGSPEILFCDEPTGALDSVNEKQVQDILVDLNKSKKLTIVMVTHNPDFANVADLTVTMKDGLVFELRTK